MLYWTVVFVWSGWRWAGALRRRLAQALCALVADWWKFSVVRGAAGAVCFGVPLAWSGGACRAIQLCDNAVLLFSFPFVCNLVQRVTNVLGMHNSSFRFLSYKDKQSRRVIVFSASPVRGLVMPAAASDAFA